MTRQFGPTASSSISPARRISRSGASARSAPGARRRTRAGGRASTPAGDPAPRARARSARRSRRGGRARTAVRRDDRPAFQSVEDARRRRRRDPGLAARSRTRAAGPPASACSSAYWERDSGARLVLPGAPRARRIAWASVSNASRSPRRVRLALGSPAWARPPSERGERSSGVMLIFGMPTTSIAGCAHVSQPPCLRRRLRVTPSAP